MHTCGRWNLLAFLFLALTICCVSARAANPTGLDDPLATLRAGHPRLIVLDDQIQSVKRMVAADTAAADAFSQVKNPG